MRKPIRNLLALVGLLAAGSFGFAQTSLTFTSLNAAVTNSTSYVSVASTTGIVAGTVLAIEDGTSGSNRTNEAMYVVSVPTTGTVIQVVRGYDQTIPQAHISGALVLAGPTTAFYEYDPAGSCTATNQPYTPYVNLKTGNQWLCSTITNSWVPGFFNTDAPNGVTAAVASVAGATLPSGPLFHVTGTNAITAWGSSTSVGLAGGGGSKTDVVGSSFCVIPDAIFTTTATNNIALASTAVVNKILCFVFDQTNKKYVPSY